MSKSVKTFYQWLVDKYGPEEAVRRYEVYKRARATIKSAGEILFSSQCDFTKDGQFSEWKDAR